LFAAEMGVASPQIDPAAIKLLTRHSFPGNVRELKNIIERALIESSGEMVQPAHIHLTASPAAPPITPAAATASLLADADELPLNLEAAENLLIKRALAETGGNIAEAARRLGINRTRIYRKLGESGSLSLDNAAP
jgi:DNA-binding NtrC family response regulator